jgi:hypothetical protein
MKEKKKGGLMIHWQHYVLEGAHAGEVAHDFSQLTSESDFPIRLLRARIAMLGYTVPDDLMEYEELIPQIANAKPTYSMRIEHADGFARCKIEALLESRGPAMAAHAAQEARQSISPQATAPAPVEDEEEPGVDVGSEVSFVASGVTYVGKIDSFQGNEAAVDVPGEVDLFGVPLEELTLVDGAEEPATDDASDNFDELVSFAEANSVEVPEGADQDQLVEMLGAYEWKRAELAPHEAALLGAVGVVMTEPAPPPAPKPAPARRIAKKKAAPARKKAPKKKKKGVRKKR